MDYSNVRYIDPCGPKGVHTVDLAGFAFFFSCLAMLFYLFKVLLQKGKRRRALLGTGVAVAAACASLVGFGIATDHEAKEQGFLSSIDRSDAKAAGYTYPIYWAKDRDARQAATNAGVEADTVRKIRALEALNAVVAYVAEVTRDMPSRFEDHGKMIREEERMQPLAADVLAYARFYWTVDSIENNCQFLGQRTNIQILEPSNGVTSWVATASGYPRHPNYPEFVGIFEKFATAVKELGATEVCGSMYALLGPNGSLMEDALAINDLIDPELVYLWEVRAEDGVLWSSKDYCDRRYYLQEPAQQSVHDTICAEAKAQDF